MDPLSHVIFGRTLIALDRHGRFGPGAAAAAALGAIAPDIDVIAIWRGWDVYLRVHEIGTHSIAGSAAVAGATAMLVYSVKRAEIRRIVSGGVDRRTEPRHLRSRFRSQHQNRLAFRTGTVERAARRHGRPVAHRNLHGRRSRAMGIAPTHIRGRGSHRCGNRSVSCAQRSVDGDCDAAVG